MENDLAERLRSIPLFRHQPYNDKNQKIGIAIYPYDYVIHEQADMSRAIAALSAADKIAETLRLYVDHEKFINPTEAREMIAAYRDAVGGNDG